MRDWHRRAGRLGNSKLIREWGPHEAQQSACPATTFELLARDAVRVLQVLAKDVLQSLCDLVVIKNHVQLIVQGHRTVSRFMLPMVDQTPSMTIALVCRRGGRVFVEAMPASFSAGRHLAAFKTWPRRLAKLKAPSFRRGGALRTRHRASGNNPR